MTNQRKRVAIIGSGISGLTAAHFISKNHSISVFEANDYIGGHTATKDVTVGEASYAVDTGFIVFNDWTYPNFIRLMDEIGVERQATEMSFSVKNEKENLEYNGHNLNTLFAQRRNLVRPKFLRIVADIVRFNKLCKAVHESDAPCPPITLFEFIQQNAFSDDFTQNYILPMCAAIWSSSLEDAKSFPFEFFLQFFTNHGLLNLTERPQWYTIKGGSRSYIAPLTHSFKDRIHLNSPATNVRRHEARDAWLLDVHDETHEFDNVVFACHSDQALAMLAQPSSQHQAILGNIPYAKNEVVLHTDAAVLPKRKLAWASWNYDLLDEEISDRPASVTYNMNILQRLESEHTFCVTLNNTQAVQANKVLGQYDYAHPQFSVPMVRAQRRRNEINGVDGLYFCGAYWYNGFHEDGVKSAIDVSKAFGDVWN
jgi:predicted NAD/FAD-binding protein